MTTRIFIDGGAGTTGLEIAARLQGREDLQLLRLDDDLRKDPSARRDALNAADIVILCLPDEAARQAVAMIDNPATRVIDASSAHRTAPGWVYGFAELTPDQRDQIRNARLVSNPGCYPTGALALLAPLTKAGLLPRDHGYCIHAASGYSGGGKGLIDRFQQDEPDIGFRSYGMDLAHKHVPEMQLHAGLEQTPIFSPTVIRAYRGMVVEIPLFLDPARGFASAREISDALCAHYEAEPLVRVETALSGGPQELLLREDGPAHDALTLHLFASKDARQLRMIAMLDNLGKGAGGAAVQNLNIMAGLGETTGLRLP